MAIASVVSVSIPGLASKNPWACFTNDLMHNLGTPLPEDGVLRNAPIAYVENIKYHLSQRRMRVPLKVRKIFMANALRSMVLQCLQAETCVTSSVNFPTPVYHRKLRIEPLSSNNGLVSVKPPGFNCHCCRRCYMMLFRTRILHMCLRR